MQDIGLRLKTVRKSKGLTLMALAKEAGLSASYISNLERGACSPTIDNLQNICGALGISIVKLLDDQTWDNCVIRANEREIIYEQKGQVRYESIDFGANRTLSGLEITIEPHCKYQKEWSHDYEEMGLILKGELTLSLNNEEYTLTKGDAFYIESNAKHKISNNTDEDCVSYWVKIESK